jgi:hypothetical protein
MIRLATQIFAAAASTLAFAAAPANAQSDDVENLRFFERAAVGPVELTPFGVVRDRRCSDPRFCWRPEDMRVSVILHDQSIPREVVLRLGERTAVPGGYLVLTDPGTRPRSRGALPLSAYALDILFIPLSPAQGGR